MAGTPNKIVLKSTTKMSLNDRFSAYRGRTDFAVNAIRQRVLQMRQAAAKNKRLVQQLENRPSVIAALKLKKRSLKQRLGQAGGGGGFDPQRLSRDGRQASKFTRGRSRGGTRGGNRWKLLTRQEANKASAPLLKNRLGGGVSQTRGARRRGGWDARARLNRGGVGGAAGGRGGVKGFRGSQRGFRGWNTNVGGRRQFRGGQIRGGNNQSSLRGGQRGGRRGGGGGRFNRGRGGGRGGGRFGGRGGGAGSSRGAGNQRNSKALPSKQTLDNELDEYMSQSKGNLDAELETYMSQAQSE